MLRYLLSSFIFLSFINILGAEETRNNLWFGTFANKNIVGNYSYWIETQFRYNLDEGQTNQILYRTGVLQKINQKHSLGYLLAYIQSGNVREHRLTLQHAQNYGKIGKYKLSHRARLEGRFLENNDQDSSRFRYLIRADEESDEKYSFVFWNELFVNLNYTDWNGDRSFERNRLFIGVKKYFFESNRIEFGYLNQFVPREEENIQEHILTFYLFF